MTNNFPRFNVSVTTNITLESTCGCLKVKLLSKRGISKHEEGLEEKTLDQLSRVTLQLSLKT